MLGNYCLIGLVFFCSISNYMHNSISLFWREAEALKEPEDNPFPVFPVEGNRKCWRVTRKPASKRFLELKG